MSTTENPKTSSQTKKPELEDMGQGVRGRSIPPEELRLDEDQIKKLVEESGSDAFAAFLYSVYKIKPPKEKTK